MQTEITEVEAKGIVELFSKHSLVLVTDVLTHD